MPDDLVADHVDPTPPVAAPPPTQTVYPWRATLRTVFQAVIALAAVIPVAVAALDVDDPGPIIGAVLVVCGGMTRLMAVPAVEAFLQRWLPWLAAKPRPGA